MPFLQCEFGLTQRVDAPIHGNNLLDRAFINVPEGYQTQVFKNLVKTKRQTVLVVPYGVPYCVPKKPRNIHYMTYEVTILTCCDTVLVLSISRLFFCVKICKLSMIYFSTALGCNQQLHS